MRYKKTNIDREEYIEKIRLGIIKFTSPIDYFVLEDQTTCFIWESNTEAERHVFLTCTHNKTKIVYEIKIHRHIHIIKKYSPKKSFKEFINFMDDYSTCSPFYEILDDELNNN